MLDCIKTSSMGFTGKVQIDRNEWSIDKLTEFGLATLEDLKSIGFFDFEEDFKTAVCFEVILKSIPVAQDAYGKFLADFGRKVERWQYIVYAQAGEISFDSADKIQQFIKTTRPLLLASYLRQDNLNGFWATFPAQGRSLDTYLQDCDPKPSPFGLGFQIEESYTIDHT